MVLENDLASQLVVEESDVFDDPFYEALVATEQAQEGVLSQRPVTHAEPTPPPESIPDAPAVAAISEDAKKPLLNTTASALVEEADNEHDASAVASAIGAEPEKSERAADSEAAENAAPRTSGSDIAAQAEPEPALKADSGTEEIEDTAKKPDTAAESDDTHIAPTPKPQRKHGFRSWLKRLFRHS